MRRKGVKLLLTVLAIVILGGVITLYLIGKSAKVNPDRKLNGVSDEFCSVLYYASLAANSHNMHSWNVKLDVREQEIILFIDAERTLEIVDPEYRELYISLGCYIEALTYAFDAYGYNTMVEYADFSDIHNDIAIISYCRREDAEINNRQIETIIRRHTDKRSYNKDRLNTEVITQLLKDTDGIYCYETGTMEFEYLKNGTMKAIIKQSAEAKY